MIAAFDVCYSTRGHATVAAVLFRQYSDSMPAAEYRENDTGAADYVSGRFFERELPCILRLLERMDAVPTVMIVDGYVTLGKAPGLGHYLFHALKGDIPVIGVAKSEFAGASAAAVYRGRSRKPLYVTSVGLDVLEAAENIRIMHGEHRIPTLLKRVDRLGREKIDVNG